MFRARPLLYRWRHSVDRVIVERFSLLLRDLVIIGIDLDLDLYSVFILSFYYRSS